jgi:hypothetical protein
MLLLLGFVWFPSLFTGLDLANPDDFYHITQAALHHTPQEVAGWFTRGYWAYTHYEYRPLTRLSLLLNYLLAGPRPWAYHLGNVLLHLGCAYLLAALAARLGAPLWAARLSGLIAAILPPGKMAVTWINGRQDLLCAFFVLAGACLFVDWLGGRRWPRLAAAALCVLLAALAKEPGAAAPLFLLGLVFLTPGKRPLAHRLAGVVGVSISLIPYVILRLRAWPLDQYADQNSLQLRPLSVAVTWFFGELMAPRLYELVTTWRSQGLLLIFSPRFPRLFLEQAAFWVGLLALFRNQRSLLAVGLAWKATFFLPVYNLYWNPAFTHYRYLPHLGTALLVGLAVWELAAWGAGRLHGVGRPLVRWAIVAVGLLLLGRYYVRQLEQRWPPWSLIVKGGSPPPVSFTRDLKGKDAPRFDDAAIYAPRERP